jgi:hypothetical protein
VRGPDDVERAPYTHLPALVGLLGRAARTLEAGALPADRVRLVGGDLLLLLRRPIHDRLPPRIVWLDATAQPRLYGAAFGRPTRVLGADVRLVGRVLQVYDRANGKRTLVDPAGAPTPKADQAQALIRAICTQRGYARPAVITFQACEEGMGLDETGHFYAARGTNQYEGCDALFVLGTPMPAPDALLDQARMLFFEREEEFTAPWTPALRPYAYTDPSDGQGRAYPVGGYWDDPDLSAVLWANREAEIIQAAHRARPIHQACDVWLLTNLPLEGLPPDALVSVREVLGAPEGVHPYLWQRLVEAAEELAARHGVVTAPALAERLGASRPTIYKYMALLEGTGAWERALVKRGAGGGSGAPARALTHTAE